MTGRSYNDRLLLYYKKAEVGRLRRKGKMIEKEIDSSFFKRDHDITDLSPGDFF